MTIEERLDAVERANKHWQIAVAVLGVVAIIIASLNKLLDTIRVRRLEVVNGRGKPIVEIAKNSHGQGQIRILGGSQYPSGEKLPGEKPVVIASIEDATDRRDAGAVQLTPAADAGGIHFQPIPVDHLFKVELADV